MKKGIKVSVLVPIFNQAKYIGRCLRSLISQTFNRNLYEIIVIDDGSKDSTKHILGAFKEELVIVEHKKTLGLPSALNSGIKKSKGEYFVRVDADDYVNNEYLKMLYLFLSQNTYFDAVACDYLRVNDNEKVLSRNNCLKKPIGCGIIFKKKQIKKIGLYNKNCLINEDKDLMRRFEKKYFIYRLPIPLYRYRYNPDSLTNKKIKKID